MYKIYRFITIFLYYSKGLWILDYFSKNKKDVILGYHRFGNKKDFLPNSLTISNKLFSKQLKLLAKIFSVVSLENLVMDLNINNKFKRSVAITIDDGFKDFYRNGLPLLKRYNMPFTIFVCTKMISSKKLLPLHKFYYILDKEDPEVLIKKITSDNNFIKELSILNSKPEKFVRAIEKKFGFQLNSEEGSFFIESLNYKIKSEEKVCSLYLSWNDLKQIKLYRSSIGAHTHNHLRLGLLNKEKQEKEIEKSKNIIIKELNYRPKEFAFPFGDELSFNHETIKLLKKTGFKIACTTKDGFLKPNENYLKLKRKMHLNKPIDVFAFEILGYDEVLRSLYSSLRNKYNSFFEFMPIGQVMRYRNIFNQIQPIEAKKILEIGASSASYLKKLSLTFPNSEISGIDFLENNVRDLNQYNIKNIRYFFDDIQKPSSRVVDKKFDLIICSDVLCHLDDDIVSIKNIFNLLKQSGTLYIHTPTEKWKRIFKESNKFDINSFDMIRPGYSLVNIKSILENIGFEVTKYLYTNKFLGKLVWELEQKANKYKYLTRLLFPFLVFFSKFDSLIGQKGNGILLICKKNNNAKK